MRWFWIILGIVALFWLFGRLRLGVHVALKANSPIVKATVGPFDIQLIPAKPKKEKPPEKKAKKASERDAKKPKEKKKLPKITLADIRSALDALLPPLRRALHRTRRSIRIAPLDLSVIVGGAQDPAAAAELYGYIHMGVWTGMPALEQLLVIPDPHIHVGIDFDAPQTMADGEAGISIRVGTLVAVAFGLALPALKWFLYFLIKTTAAGSGSTEPKTARRVRERTVSYGRKEAPPQ